MEQAPPLSTLLCLSGLDTEAFIERAALHIPRTHHLTLLYVLDTRPIEEVGYRARLTQGSPRFATQHAGLADTADSQTAAAVLNEAGEKCMQLGFNARNVRREVRRGRPEQQIIDLAYTPEANIGLVVVGSAYKRGRRSAHGPASIGHVARFVLDNSPCDVLLLR